MSFNKAPTMDRNDFIEQSMPFIIKTTSSFLGRYVCTDNDEEFSIALIALMRLLKNITRIEETFGLLQSL